MDRPTCVTCPYWRDEHEPDHGGECHGVTPAPALACGDDTLPARVVWPRTLNFEFCPAHPDFPAYLDSRRRSLLPKRDPDPPRVDPRKLFDHDRPERAGPKLFGLTPVVVCPALMAAFSCAFTVGVTLGYGPDAGATVGAVLLFALAGNAGGLIARCLAGTPRVS